jgi:hypothetical protein
MAPDKRPEKPGVKSIVMTFVRLFVLALLAWAIVTGVRMLVGA